MGFLILISLRNLLRQKRRNLLLGGAIAVGMAVLAVANAFSHGISDVMFNRIMTYVTGHVSVAFSERGNTMSQVFHDGDRVLALARQAAPGAKVEEAIGVFTRVVGNRATDNVILIGIDLNSPNSAKERAELEADFGMTAGSFADLGREDVENPLLLSAEKAAYLKAKPGDVLRARFQDVYGRNQAVRLTVAGLFKPANVFMNAPAFMDIRRLKPLAGYGTGDIGGFQVNLEEPKKNAIPVADSLHAVLKPSLAAAWGLVSRDGRTLPAAVLGFKVDTASLARLPAILGGAAPDAKSILVGRVLADSLGLRPGEACTLSYARKYGGDTARAAFRATAIIPASAGLPGDLLLVNDRDFYGFYYAAWPAPSGPESGAFRPDTSHPLRPLLVEEWILMDRTATTEAMRKKYREASRLKTRATLVDVQTMYESASMIINLEYALNLITLAAVLILFFIIQVGVINTLRMTIRERTREIGTMRAIGMPRGDVRTQFLLETFFLSSAACLAGLILAYLGMWLLRGIPFQPDGNPLGMLLVNGRLHFKPSLAGTAAYVALILAIAAATAWFPARRAANLQPSEALRHFG